MRLKPLSSYEKIVRYAAYLRLVWLALVPRERHPATQKSRYSSWEARI